MRIVGYGHSYRKSLESGPRQMAVFIILLFSLFSLSVLAYLKYTAVVRAGERVLVNYCTLEMAVSRLAQDISMPAQAGFSHNGRAFANAIASSRDFYDAVGHDRRISAAEAFLDNVYMAIEAGPEGAEISGDDAVSADSGIRESIRRIADMVSAYNSAIKRLDAEADGRLRDLFMALSGAGHMRKFRGSGS